MNKTFIIGRKYSLRKEYPIINTSSTYFVAREITFENRCTFWNQYKINLFDLKPRKVLDTAESNNKKKIVVIFEGVPDGFWEYHPEDFIEFSGSELLELEYNELMLKW